MKEIASHLIYYPFLNLLTFFTWLSPGHYAAVGIILLTLTVRLLLILPSKRAAQGQRRMAQLQPLMDELKRDYGNDKAALGAAQMELYKKNGVNPFSSCVLMLIQFPILYIMYIAILKGLAPNNPHLYTWLPRPDFVNTFLFGIDLTHPDKTYILPILAAAIQFVQTKMTLPPKPKDGVQMDPQQAMQQNMMYFFPLITLLIARGFPAGVALYWVVTNLFSVGQQYFVNKERLSLEGVEKAVDTVEKIHPEATARIEKVEKEVLDGTTTKAKGGVSVTVRKKKKK